MDMDHPFTDWPIDFRHGFLASLATRTIVVQTLPSGFGIAFISIDSHSGHGPFRIGHPRINLLGHPGSSPQCQPGLDQKGDRFGDLDFHPAALGCPIHLAPFQGQILEFDERCFLEIFDSPGDVVCRIVLLGPVLIPMGTNLNGADTHTHAHYTLRLLAESHEEEEATGAAPSSGGWPLALARGTDHGAQGDGPRDKRGPALT